MAAQVSWDALRPESASSIVSLRLDTSVEDHLIFKPTKLILFCVTFVVLMIITIVGGILISNHQTGEWDLESTVFAFVMPYALYKSFSYMHTWLQPKFFDTFRGVYYSHWFQITNPTSKQAEQTIPIKDIVALQILKKRVRADNRSTVSHELNLVLKDMKRVNVIDHSKIKTMKKDALKLARRLGIPLWDGRNLQN